MFNYNAEKTQLNIIDQSKIKAALDDLRNNKTATNWVLLSYAEDKKNDLFLQATGTGGFDELKSHLTPNNVKYGVFEVVVKGDTYNPVKFMLLTWIGKEVTPGLGKARCAAHRNELYAFVNGSIGIAGEFQPADDDLLDYETIAAKLTRVANQSSTSDKTRQEVSRSHVETGDRSKSRVNLDDQIAAELKRVYQGQATWTSFGYSDTEKDRVEFLETGNGTLNDIKRLFADDKIRFCVFCLEYLQPGFVEKVKKYILITMVGPSVPPLKKARSSGQRQDIVDFVLASCPFHLHFQPNDAEEITEKNIVSKFV
jgi:hypothetical protein